MKKPHILTCSASRIAHLFSYKKNKKASLTKKHEKQKYMRLNFLVLNAFLKESKQNLTKNRKRSFSFLPLFTSKILNSDNPHLIAIIEQAQSCCIKQDLHLFPFQQFFLRNEFTMRRVIEWRFSKYIIKKDQLNFFIERMKDMPPDVFHSHLVTLIDLDQKDEEFSKEEKARKEQESNWTLWKKNANGDSCRISRS